jgi:hypothetical protein
MILGSISILLIILLSGMILMSVPSASYTQGSTVSSNLTGMTSNTSRVATSNSNVSIISDDQEVKAKLLAKDLEDTLRDGVSALELISIQLL